MDDFLKRWQWRGGVAALLVSLFFTGAWVKTAVDQLTTGHRAVTREDTPSLIGNIVITGECYSHISEQTQWTVSGLYSKARIVVESTVASPDASEPESIAETREEVAEITAVAHRDVADSTNNLVMQASATDNAADFDFTNPPSQVPLAIDAPQDDFWVGSVEVDDDFEKTLDWRRWGLRLEQRTGPDAGWDCLTVVPHWMMTLSCSLVAAALLFGSHRNGKNSRAVTSATPTRNSLRAASPTGFFDGWQPKIGALTLLITLALMAGWIRSFVVADLLCFEASDEKDIRFASGKEGLVYQTYISENQQGCGTRYRTRTGAAYEKFTFRPNWERELQELEDLTLNITTQPPSAASSPVVQFTQPGSETLPSPPPSAPQPPPHPYGSVSLPSGQPIPPESLPLQTFGVVSLPPKPLPYGSSYEWGGLYAHFSPGQTTVVIPYGYLIIPLTILSAALLVGHRRKFPLPTGLL